jgi:hypothetical protein
MGSCSCLGHVLLLFPWDSERPSMDTGESHLMEQGGWGDEPSEQRTSHVICVTSLSSPWSPIEAQLDVMNSSSSAFVFLGEDDIVRLFRRFAFRWASIVCRVSCWSWGFLRFLQKRFRRCSANMNSFSGRFQRMLSKLPAHRLRLFGTWYVRYGTTRDRRTDIELSVRLPYDVRPPHVTILDSIVIVLFPIPVC